MYFHTDSPTTLDFIARVAALAEENYQSLRIDVDSEGNLKIKRGEGVWSPPIPSTPDPYRDASQQTGACQSHCDIHYFNDECVGFHNAY